jgi:hypothetical protein
VSVFLSHSVAQCFLWSGFNRKHPRVGSLFQGRFKAILVAPDGPNLKVSRCNAYAVYWDTIPESGIAISEDSRNSVERVPEETDIVVSVTSRATPMVAGTFTKRKWILSASAVVCGIVPRVPSDWTNGKPISVKALIPACTFDKAKRCVAPGECRSECCLDTSYKCDIKRT